jgi:hypothetical protein
MSGDTKDEANRLRKRGCWYREFAKLGSTREAIGRNALAELT